MNMSDQKSSVLDILLRADVPDMRKHLPEKQVEVPRLSQAAGTPVVLTLRGLTYDEVRKVQDKPRDEQAVSAVLYGTVEPVWKGLVNQEKGQATPVDAMKAVLSPGEIDDLYIEIQKLSGYLYRTISDVKNA
jgi:hypothetical protein